MTAARTTPIHLALVLACLASPRGARAADGAAGGLPVLMLASRAEEGIHAAAAGELGSQLSDLPVRFEVRWVEAFPADLREQIELARGIATAGRAGAVIWVDFAAPGRVYLFVADAEGGRLLVREAGSGDESEEGRLMTMGVIVRGAVRGVLAGDTTAAAAVPPPPPPPPSTGRDGLFEFGLGYALQLHSEEIPALHGARLEAAVRLAGPLRLLAAYRIHLPPRIERDSLMVGLLLYPAELGLALGFAFAPWDLEAGIGAVLTVVDLDLASADRKLVPEDDVWRVEFAINPWVGARLRLGPVVALFLRASTDVVVNRHRYVVDLGDRVETVVRPWRWRPLFLLGASFSAP